MNTPNAPNADRPKRPASSPAQSSDSDKRLCDGGAGAGDVGAWQGGVVVGATVGPTIVFDSGETLTSGGGAGAGAGVELSESSMARLVEAVSARVRADLATEMGVLRGEVVRLRAELGKRDTVINDLREQLHVVHQRLEETDTRAEENAQYSRRNSVRIHGIPETKDELTDNIIVRIGEEIGADIFPEHIDRSHRVGRESDEYARPIICKFTSHKQKLALLTKKKKLKDVEVHEIFGADAIYINEDLTKQRAQLAKHARVLKKKKLIEDTWTRDGVIFVKSHTGNINRHTTLKDLPSIPSDD